MVPLARLQTILDNAPDVCIGLIGDLFLDRYLDIEPNVDERSVETGLEAYQIQSVRNSPGALGTLINNLVALGVGRIIPLSVIGEDGHGFDLLGQLERETVDRSRILRAADRLTPTYTKPLRWNPQTNAWEELNRLDVRSRGPLDRSTTERLCRELSDLFEECDGIMVLDQISETNWGVVNDDVRDAIRDATRRHPDKVVFVDSRGHLSSFAAGILKGNQDEIAGLGRAANQDLPGIARALSVKTGQAVYVTRGSEGILVVLPNGQTQQAEGIEVAGPLDIVGAGDAASSGIVLSLLGGATHLEAASVGNLVASITIQQLGTTGVATPEQLLSRRLELE